MKPYGRAHPQVNSINISTIQNTLYYTTGHTPTLQFLLLTPLYDYGADIRHNAPEYPFILLPVETPCKTCGSLYAVCGHKFAHTHHHPSQWRQTADRNSGINKRTNKKKNRYYINLLLLIILPSLHINGTRFRGRTFISTLINPIIIHPFSPA